MKRWRRYSWCGLAAFAGWWAVGFASAWLASRPVHRPMDPAVESRTELHGRPAEEVQTSTSDGLPVCGSLVRPAAESRRCVVLVPGIHGDRRAMQARAAWYLERGWATLLVDLRGTGRSAAASVTMGLHEARDLIAWAQWLRGRGFAEVAAHGCSLGAAAIVYAGDQPWAFAVLEGCYRDLDAALAARLPWVPFPALAFWPLRCCAEWQLGLRWSDLRPVDAIATLHCPTLLLAGAEDDKIGPGALQELLARSPAAHKRAIEIPGASHDDLWTVARDRMAQALDAFVPQ